MTGRAVGLVLILAAACGPEPILDPDGPDGGAATFSVVNGAGAAGTIKVYVDGAFAADVAVGQQGARLAADPGPHQVELRRADGTGAAARQLTLQAGVSMIVVAWDSLGVLRPAVLDDSNSVVAPGKSKLRVAHFAGLAGPIDIWRTQPDYATPIRIMFPFRYGEISPFVESTPGTWRVLVSTAITAPIAPMPDTLAMTGGITAGDGEARTVIVVDRAGGGVEAIVLEP